MVNFNNSAAQQVEEQAAIHPLQAVQRLSNVINTIDYVLARPDAQMQNPETRRQTIFLRNTLIVSLDLWQDDVHRRLNKSRENFYVYCMTDGERVAFRRRIGPGLDYAVEVLRNIDSPALAALIPVLEQNSRDALIYADHSKACLRMALAEDLNSDLLTHQTMPIPPAAA